MHRHPKPGDYYVLNETAFPSVLIECGFLTNTAEAKLLNTTEYQRFLAHHIAISVLGYIT